MPLPAAGLSDAVDTSNKVLGAFAKWDGLAAASPRGKAGGARALGWSPCPRPHKAWPAA